MPLLNQIEVVICRHDSVKRRYDAVVADRATKLIVSPAAGVTQRPARSQFHSHWASLTPSPVRLMRSLFVDGYFGQATLSLSACKPTFALPLSMLVPICTLFLSTLRAIYTLLLAAPEYTAAPHVAFVGTHGQVDSHTHWAHIPKVQNNQEGGWQGRTNQRIKPGEGKESKTMGTVEGGKRSAPSEIRSHDTQISSSVDSIIDKGDTQIGMLTDKGDKQRWAGG
ncbi:hypothetical protein B0H16DRAFT_1473514 [Mycena metata]|uniref:Uncharacterized protein n=1 Tax=Mycena metata TaxID=1033252 RepID=A0AAD7HJE3_9AGAR|nr:hypothetical protein B0H16DRAFT_1473514 [Mycena metata]